MKDKCGCITMIRGSNFYVAATPELTAEIRSDERIPKNADLIRVEHLPVFAEWQRKLDIALDRK